MYSGFWSLYGAELRGGDVMEVWDFLTFLWNKAIEFLSFRIDFLGLNFTLWEFALGAAVLSLLLYAVFRALD